MKILIIEDHKKINDLLTLYARQDGHEVEQAFCGEQALIVIHEKHFDAIITDLMLPTMQGEELIRIIRLISDVYLVVISAKVDIKDKLNVLTLGVDDYLTKPFSVEEVMAKLKNIEKRIENKNPLIHSYNRGELLIYPLTREIFSHHQVIDLTRYEYDVLWHLASHRERIYSRDDLIQTCFEDSDAFDRVIDAYIKNIRKKLNDDARNSTYIKTHYGLGYQFVGELDD